MAPECFNAWIDFEITAPNSPERQEFSVNTHCVGAPLVTQKSTSLGCDDDRIADLVKMLDEDHLKETKGYDSASVGSGEDNFWRKCLAPSSSKVDELLDVFSNSLSKYDYSEGLGLDAAARENGGKPLFRTLQSSPTTNGANTISASTGSSWSQSLVESTLVDPSATPMEVKSGSESNEGGIAQPRDAKYGFRRTSICKYWQRGVCLNENCNFAHGKKELQSTIGVWKTTICHYWKQGNCRVGANCRHAHGEEELQPTNIPAYVLKNKLLHSSSCKRERNRPKAPRPPGELVNHFE